MLWNKRSYAKKIALIALLSMYCLLLFAISSAAQDVVDEEALSKREADVKAKENSLNELEASLRIKEDSLRALEADVKAREISLNELEISLKSKEDSLRELETDIKAKSESVDKREADLRAQDEALAARSDESRLKEEAQAELEMDKAKQERDLRARRRARAAGLVRSGDSLAKDKNYSGALEKYEQAYKIYPSEEINIRRYNARRAAEETK